jgi:ABC-type branched-subunit amino acid transport system ATPase component
MDTILEVSGLSKRFGGVVAVRDADLRVETGSITAIIGPNGAGKTSLFNVVSGFEHPDGGTVRFQGTRIDGLLPWQIAQRGLVRSFQTPAGFPALSVRENLMVAGTLEVNESLWKALTKSWRRDQTDVMERAESILKDLDLWQHRDVLLEDLSPGDTKLVDFARLLMASPAMMLLDEPASGVDVASITQLTDLIKRLRGDGITVLVIDHNIGFVLGIADSVNVMSLGQVIAHGTPEDIVEDERVLEIYLGKRA